MSIGPGPTLAVNPALSGVRRGIIRFFPSCLNSLESTLYSSTPFLTTRTVDFSSSQASDKKNNTHPQTYTSTPPHTSPAPETSSQHTAPTAAQSASDRAALPSSTTSVSPVAAMWRSDLGPDQATSSVDVSMVDCLHCSLAVWKSRVVVTMRKRADIASTTGRSARRYCLCSAWVPSSLDRRIGPKARQWWERGFARLL